MPPRADWIARRANEHHRHATRLLRDREEDRRFGRRLHVLIANVAHDADDARGTIAALKLRRQWIVGAPDGSRGDIVDQHDRRGLATIGWRDVAAALNRNAERFEIVRSDDVKRDVCGRRASGQREVGALTVVADGRAASHRDADDAWNRRHALRGRTSPPAAADISNWC